MGEEGLVTRGLNKLFVDKLFNLHVTDECRKELAIKKMIYDDIELVVAIHFAKGVKIISIEGNIGVGKSSVVKKIEATDQIKDFYRTIGNLGREKAVEDYDRIGPVMVFHESIDMKLLEKFYHTIREYPGFKHELERATMDLEWHIFKNINELYNHAIYDYNIDSKYKKCNHYLTDRFIWGNYVFVVLDYLTGLISHSSFKVYSKKSGVNWDKRVFSVMNGKAGVHYLGVIHLYESAELCFNRIKKRDKVGDNYITLGYLLMVEWSYYMVYRHFNLFNHTFKTRSFYTGYKRMTNTFEDYLKPKFNMKRVEQLFGKDKPYKLDEVDILSHYDEYRYNNKK